MSLSGGVALGVAGKSWLACPPLCGDAASITFNVHLEDHRMVDKTVHSRECHRCIREDTRPLSEWLEPGGAYRATGGAWSASVRCWRMSEREICRYKARKHECGP
jgi:hypothetical protein